MGQTKIGWSGEVEATEILLAKLTALLPDLEKKKVIIPDEIRRLANEVIVKKLLSMRVREAKERARERSSVLMMALMIGNTNARGHGASKIGNTNARGCGAAMMGNTNGRGNKGKQLGNQNSTKYSWDDEHVRILIRGVMRFDNKWEDIRREYFSHWWVEDAKSKTNGRRALKYCWVALNKAGDSRIGEEKAKAKSKSGDLREHFGSKK
jgi:hypothetical protein